MTNQTPRDEGHSIDWVSVEIYGQENHLLSRKIREAINIHTRRREMMTVIRVTINIPPIYGTLFEASSKRG